MVKTSLPTFTPSTVMQAAASSSCSVRKVFFWTHEITPSNEEKIESTRGGGRYGGDEIRDHEDTNGVCNDEEACAVVRQEGQGVAPGSEPRNGACAVLERAHVCRWRR